MPVNLDPQSGRREIKQEITPSRFFFFGLWSVGGFSKITDYGVISSNLNLDFRRSYSKMY